MKILVVDDDERVLFVLRRILDQDSDAPAVPTAVELEAPCSVACPANICVQGYIGRIAGGRYAEALAEFRRFNHRVHCISRSASSGTMLMLWGGPRGRQPTSVRG